MPAKNSAFITFVNEWRRTNTEGRRMNLQQAIQKCGGTWKNMDAKQREPYHLSVKEMGRAKEERLDCHGQAISAVEKEMLEAEEKQSELKKKIENIVRNSRAEHDLENAKFIFVAFNYFTKALSSDIYIPAEFAACQYSLKSGKTSIYSSHINPGQILFGQGSDAQEHTSTTHQLPIPPNALGESDMGKLYNNILEYLRGCQSDIRHGEPLVVFTSTALLPVVKSCFKYLESDSMEDEGQILVYDLQYLFYVLKTEVMDMADVPHSKINKNVTDSLFLKDNFEYQMGISCQFHEENDRSKYCTLSMVSRWSFIFSDYLCGHLAIKTIPGKHMPPIQKQMFTVTNFGSSQSMRSDNSSFTSFHSVRSQVKPEVRPNYVPTDHTAFSSNIHAADDFPSLSGRKAKSQRQPENGRFSRNPNSAWDVPPLNGSAKDFEDSFNMSRR